MIKAALTSLIVAGALSGCRPRTATSEALEDATVPTVDLEQCAQFSGYDSVKGGFFLRKQTDGASYVVYGFPEASPMRVIIERRSGAGQVVQLESAVTNVDPPFYMCVTIQGPEIVVKVEDKTVWRGYDDDIAGAGTFGIFKEPLAAWTVTQYTAKAPTTTPEALNKITKTGEVRVASNIVNRLLTTSDSKLGFVFDSSGRISAWRLDNLSQAWAVTPYSGVQYWAATLAEDNTKILAAGSYGAALVLNAETGATLRTLTPPWQLNTIHWTATAIDPRGIGATAGAPKYPDPIPYGFDINPTNRLYAKAQGPKVLWLWNLQNGERTREVKFTDSTIREIGFIPEKNRLYTISYTNARIFNYETGELIKNIAVAELDTGETSPMIEGAVFSRDMRFLALSLSKDVIIVNTENNEIAQRLPGDTDSNPKALSFSKDLRQIHGMNEKGRAMSWNITTGDVAAKARPVGWYGLWGIAQMPFAFTDDGHRWLFWKQNVEAADQPIELWETKVTPTP